MLLVANLLTCRIQNLRSARITAPIWVFCLSVHLVTVAGVIWCLEPFEVVPFGRTHDACRVFVRFGGVGDLGGYGQRDHQEYQVNPLHCFLHPFRTKCVSRLTAPHRKPIANTPIKGIHTPDEHLRYKEHAKEPEQVGELFRGHHFSFSSTGQQVLPAALDAPGIRS